jgi:hypothetical protein
VHQDLNTGLHLENLIQNFKEAAILDRLQADFDKPILSEKESLRVKEK